MALALRHEGRNVYRPGGYSRRRIVAVNRPNPAALGIVDIIAEADEGPPGLTELDDPNQIDEVFGSGPAAEMALIAFNPSQDEDIPAGARKVRVYKPNQSTQSNVHAPSRNAGDNYTIDTGSTPTVIFFEFSPTPTFNAADEHNGRLVTINGETRIITDTLINDGGFDKLVLHAPLSNAPVATDTATILRDSMLLTSERYGLPANGQSWKFEAGVTAGKYIATILTAGDEDEVTPEMGLDPYFRLTYDGGPTFNPAGAALGTGTVSAAQAATYTSNGSTIDIDFDSGTTGTPALHEAETLILHIDGTGIRRLIATNTAGDAGGKSTVTLDDGHFLTAADRALITLGTTTVKVVNVTQAQANITGTSGVATALTSAVLPTAEDLSINFATLELETLQQLADYVNTNTNYTMTIADGVDPGTLLATLDFGTRNTAVDVRFSADFEDQQLQTWSSGVGTDDTFVNDTTVWTGGVQRRNRFYRDLQNLIDYLNLTSDRATVVRATAGTTEGAELPGITSALAPLNNGDDTIPFIGGTRGASSNSDWQAGFDALLKGRGASVCVGMVRDLSLEAGSSTATLSSVAAMLAAHIIARNTTARNNAAGYIGIKGAEAVVRGWGKFFNSMDVHVFGQEFQALNVQSNTVWHPEWSGPAFCAGMRAGSRELGEPMTAKRIGALGVRQDPGWEPDDDAAFNRLTQDGVMVAQLDEDAGVVWVRDRTSYVANPERSDVLTDGNMAEEGRFLTYDFTKRLADKFKGKKSGETLDTTVPASITAIKDAAVEILELYRLFPYNILSNSEDPESTLPPGQRPIVPGFDRVSVQLTGNVAKVSARCFLAPGIVFLLTDLSIHVPVLSA